jgi:D-glycero-beta-D-manno-heptose 1-phosphate adenylyltransferase
MNRLEILKSKIFGRDDANFPRLIKIWKFKNYKIVFTNGCFDILHLGHIDYLAKASELGDKLIIGLNTDDSVRTLKGQNRPIQDEISRAMILASLSFVDAVVFFGEDTPLELIKTVQPDVLVKGSDYKPEEIVGYEVVKAEGGETITLDYLPGYSTSGLVEKIMKG